MPTRTDVFLDTNILLYAIDEGDRRCLPATQTVSKGGVISVQVLNEFAAVARRKFKFTWPSIEAALARFRRLFSHPLAIDVDTHERAMGIAARDGLSIFDSLLIASALDAGCTQFLSEDMQHGRRIEDRLTIRNPFLQ